MDCFSSENYAMAGALIVFGSPPGSKLSGLAVNTETGESVQPICGNRCVAPGASLPGFAPSIGASGSTVCFPFYRA